jgi:hypothetical protein
MAFMNNTLLTLGLFKAVFYDMKTTLYDHDVPRAFSYSTISDSECVLIRPENHLVVPHQAIHTVGPSCKHNLMCLKFANRLSKRGRFTNIIYCYAMR